MKPTIDELEALLNVPDGAFKIDIQPDGSIISVPTEDAALIFAAEITRVRSDLASAQAEAARLAAENGRLRAALTPFAKAAEHAAMIWDRHPHHRHKTFDEFAGIAGADSALTRQVWETARDVLVTPPALASGEEGK